MFFSLELLRKIFVTLKQLNFQICTRKRKKRNITETCSNFQCPSQWDLVSDKQMMQEEQPLQVARCTKIISPNTEDAKYVINVKQIAKALQNLFWFISSFFLCLDCSLWLALAIKCLPLTLKKACALGMFSPCLSTYRFLPSCMHIFLVSFSLSPYYYYRSSYVFDLYSQS